jgi:hypothetical protein
MSKKDEALKLALEALEHLQPTALTSFYTIGDRNKAITALREALAEQPAPVQQGGLEMVDDEGENQAVRMFLALYGGQYGITAEQMRKHLKMAGFDNAWPEWANSHNGHLTKAGAQLWIRHLFALAEQPAQQKPVNLRRGDILRCIETDELCTVWATSITGKTLVKWSANNFGDYTAEQIGELFWLEPEPDDLELAAEKSDNYAAFHAGYRFAVARGNTGDNT